MGRKGATSGSPTGEPVSSRWALIPLRLLSCTRMGRRRFALVLTLIALGLAVLTAGGCGGSSQTTTRTRLAFSYLPDALSKGVWPGLRVYRTGTLYEANTDHMPSGWEELYGGPYSEADICVSILNDLVFVHGMTVGDVTVNVYTLGFEKAGTGPNGKCEALST